MIEKKTGGLTTRAPRQSAAIKKSKEEVVQKTLGPQRLSVDIPASYHAKLKVMSANKFDPNSLQRAKVRDLTIEALDLLFAAYESGEGYYSDTE